jgi:hypothetical protein
VLDLPGQSLASQLNTSGIQVASAAEWSTFAELCCKKTRDITALNVPSPVLYVPPDTVRFSSPADLTMPARRFGMLPTPPPFNGTVQEMAGLPADRLLSVAKALPLGFLTASRSYPYLGETAIDNGWGTAPPALGSPPPWQNDSSLQGADMLLTDVISFEVKPLVAEAGDFVDLNDARLDSFRFNPTFFIPASPRTIAITPPNPNPNGPAVFDTWSNQNDTTFNYTSSATTGSTLSTPLPVRIIALKITIRLWDAKTQQARQVSIIQEM